LALIAEYALFSMGEIAFGNGSAIMPSVLRQTADWLWKPVEIFTRGGDLKMRSLRVRQRYATLAELLWPSRFKYR